MHAFTLRPKKGQELHALSGGPAKPMRRAGIKLRRFTPREDEVPLPQDDPQTSTKNVDPLIAFVDLRIGVGQGGTAWQDQFEGLNPATTTA